MAGLLPAGRGRLPVLAIALALLLAAGCGGRRTKKVKLPPPIKNPRVGWNQTGSASWYGHPYHGRQTSNGETYDMNKMTAAHKRLPFETWLRVRNLDNGRTTEVRINDRGPFVGRRIIDLSRAAALDIGMLGPGTARVRITVIRGPSRRSRSSARSRRRQAPSPPSAPRAASGRGARFDVQLGVFSSRSNAETLARRARSLGHQARTERFSQGGKRRFRVVASGGSRDQASSLLSTLKRQGFDGLLKPR